jgi:hypothetical protein
LVLFLGSYTSSAYSILIPKNSQITKAVEIVMLEHLQQIPNTTPHPHKTELLGEIDQFSCSNSAPIPPPIFGGHQKNTHLPSNKGALATSPNNLFFWCKHTHR